MLAEMAAAAGKWAAGGGELAAVGERLVVEVAVLTEATSWMIGHGGADPAAALAGSTPYLRMFGLVTCGWLLGRSAEAALGLLASGGGAYDPDFLRAKVATARFYAAQLLPQAGGLLPAVTAGTTDLYAIEPKYLAGWR
jgi:hypothetical protein